MTYEQTLEPAYFSWLSEEENLKYIAAASARPSITPFKWQELPDSERVGKVSGGAATPKTLSKLKLIAQHQTVSESTEQLEPWAGMFYIKPSLELFQERIWDRTEGLGMTDKEVNDLAIWSAVKFLGYSYREVADFHGVTRSSVDGVVRRFKRREDKPQGDLDAQNAALVILNHT